MRRFASLLLVIAFNAWADVEPGNWEISASTRLQGISEPTSFVQTRCLTAEDARDPGRIFGSSPGVGCEFSNRNDNGSVFTFNVSCSGQPPIRGSGSVRYSRDAMDGELEMKIEELVTHSRITGRRIGGC
jgi:Protein of unknown function (DUF3617)